MRFYLMFEADESYWLFIVICLLE